MNDRHRKWERIRTQYIRKNGYYKYGVTFRGYGVNKICPCCGNKIHEEVLR